MNEREETLKAKFMVAKKLSLKPEKIGTWIWVACNSETKGNKLKSEGFEFSKNRKLYYFRVPGQQLRYDFIPFDELRSRFSDEQISIN